MSLLKKMAQLAARKAFLATITSKSPTDIKSSIEELCADARTVDALQHYAMVTAKQEGMYPLPPDQVVNFDICDEHKSMISDNPAILDYLNHLLSQFQQH